METRVLFGQKLGPETSCPKVKAYHLRPGQWYFGRDDWHLKVERVRETEHRVTVTSINGFGEEVTERYRYVDDVYMLPPAMVADKR